MKMKILKFGGTSVGTASNFKRVRDIVIQQTGDVIVVVSALGGITDLILKAARVAAEGPGDFHPLLLAIKKRHQEIIDELFSGTGAIGYITEELLDELEQILTGITLVGELTPKTLDRIAGIGERISSHLMAQYIPGAIRKDAGELIRTDSSFGKAQVDFPATNQQIRSEFASFSGIAVVPGFVAKNGKGEFTTLGRGGSDYTAAIFAAALNADALEIWTDVDGYMTADPQVIRKAYTIP
jgi:bifunctional aspartokinase / homoserine dehydrogenase 1